MNFDFIEVGGIEGLEVERSEARRTERRFWIWTGLLVALAAAAGVLFWWWPR